MSATVTGDAIRRIVLDRAHAAREGHIGSSLCVADVLAVLYGDIVVGRLTGDERDRVVLSKGHAALALFAALHLAGEISESRLRTYCADGGELGIHPQHGVPGVEFTTGSLGQGLTFAAGCALAARTRDQQWHTFVLCSDAECDEGSTWEAAMFAAQQRLGNLTLVIDHNRQQAMGSTDSVLSLGDLRARWACFGWHAVDVDGHDPAAIRDALTAARDRKVGDLPSVIVAHTVFGKGVGFMERQLRWHYSSMSDADHERAVAALEARA